jgi:glycosyltransferase involved in cell wall biosynthesis
MNRPLHVMQLIAGFAVEGPSGGIAQFGINLAQALDPQIIERTLCGLWDYKTESEKERIAVLRTKGMHVFAAGEWEEAKPYHSFVRSLQVVDSWLKRHPVDIIHSHSEFGDAAALYLGLKHRIPCLIRTLHNNTIWTHRPWRRLFLVNIMYPLIFQVEAAVSEDIVSQLNRRPLARLLGKKGRVLYNSIDLSRFEGRTVVDREKLLSGLGIPPGRLVIGTVGRLTEQKGYTFLLDAAARVVKQEPDCHFIIIGSGKMEQELKEKAHHLELNNHLTWAGARNDVPDLLQCLDIFVSSSLWEGLPTVLMESMVSNVPVVATNIPGTREVIAHQDTGLLAAPANPEALAEGIITLIQDRDLAAHLARRARASVARFDIYSVAQKYEQLYQEAAVKKGVIKT